MFTPADGDRDNLRAIVAGIPEAWDEARLQTSATPGTLRTEDALRNNAPHNAVEALPNSAALLKTQWML